MKKKLSAILSEAALLLATALCWLPIYYFLIGAFKDRMDIIKFPLQLTPQMVTLENFIQAAKKMKLFSSLGNTLFITACSLVVVVIFGSLAGFAISRVKHKLFTTFYSFVIALMVVPFIGALIPTVILIREMKLVGKLWACILIQSAWNLPFSVFLYTGFMQGLPKELEEAAYIDGCSMLQVYFRIFLPLLAPVTATCFIRCGITIWNDYLVCSSLLNSAKTPTLMVSIYQFFGQYVSEYGLAFAGIIVASLPIMVLFVFLQKYFIKGLSAGAVKG